MSACANPDCAIVRQQLSVIVRELERLTVDMQRLRNQIRPPKDVP